MADGPYTFPLTWTAVDGTPMGDRGMLLRDYFAAAALQGFCAATNFNTPINPHAIAVACYGMADAMIAARDVPEEEEPQF